MLSYERFKERLKTVIENHFDDVECVVINTSKVNKAGEHLLCKKGSTSPSIRLEDEYRVYIEMEDDEKYFARILKIADGAFKRANDIVLDQEDDSIKDNIIFQLINAEKNKELLSSVPHKRYLDLAIIYRLVLAKNDDEIATAIVTRELQEKINVSDEELFLLAAMNTRNINTPKVINMNDFILSRTNTDDEELAIISSAMEETPMFIITNESQCNGAGSILYEDILFDLATKLDSDLILLPSSLHEFLAVKDNNDSLAMAETVFQMNRNYSCVPEEIFLSDNIYRYSRDSRKITIEEV